MPDVTIILPVAPYHTELAQRAIESAATQTVHCDVMVITDDQQKGAGYARNRAIEEIKTELCVFLDADDWIAPNFVERCLSVWKPNHYVYTGWHEDTKVVSAPTEPWQDNLLEWHVITTLLPTDAVRAVGGFDEGLRAMEDTYLYWALTRAGVCGIRLDEPLFHYGKEGLRSKALYTKAIDGKITFTPYYVATMSALKERYQGMSCCGGDNPIKPFVPDQAGDIQALAIWGGNRREIGVISGRLYPRGGNGNPMSVDPRDVDASPEKWQRIQPPKAQPAPQPAILAHERPQPQVMMPVKEVAGGVAGLVEARFPGVKVLTSEPAKVLTADELAKTLSGDKPALSANVKPDASKVRRLAKGKGKAK